VMRREGRRRRCKRKSRGEKEQKKNGIVVRSEVSGSDCQEHSFLRYDAVCFGTNVSTFHGTLLQIAPNPLVPMY
jgi:hypothetical protein